MIRNTILLFFLIVLLTISYQFYGQQYTAIKAQVEPVIDGIGDDMCWRDAQWQYLEYDWFLPFDGDPASQKLTLTPNDFTGRFKVSWTPDKLYFLVEITDDNINEDNPDPLVLYYEDDCLEIFIDEDKSGGKHVNDYNAFAYHISPVKLNAIDIDITGRANFFDNHLNIKSNSAIGSYCLEIGLEIYNDKYSFGMESSTKVTLYPGKELGFSMAYCDDDGNSRENFLGWIPGGSESYADADLFGSLLLSGNIDVRAVTYSNNNFDRKKITWLRNYEYIDSLSRNYEVTSTMKTIEKGFETRKTVTDSFVPEKKELVDDNEALIAKNNFKYNNDKKLIEETFEIINDTFPGSYREEITYLSELKFEKIIQYRADNKWINDTKIIQTFLSSELISEKIMQIWRNSNWIDYYKYNYEYDLNNRLSQTITCQSDGSVWNNYSRERYDYKISEDKSYHNFYIEIWNGDWVTEYSQIASINKSGAIVTECRTHNNNNNVFVKKRITETEKTNGKEIVNELSNFQAFNKITIENSSNQTTTTIYDQDGLKINKLEVKTMGEENIDGIVATSYYNGEEIGIYEEKYYYAGNLSDCKAEIIGQEEIKDRPVILKAKYDFFDIEWYKDSKLVSFDPEIKISKGGEYKLVVRTPVCEDSKSITVNGSLPDCNAKIFYNQVPDNKVITLTSQPGPINSYQWWLGGIVISTEPQLTVSQPGRYKLIVKSEWCEDEDNITIKQENLNGINSVNSEIEILPNPAKEGIFIINNSENKISKISVYNSCGEKIIEQNNITKKYFIDLATFSIGLFVFELYFYNGKKIFKKIIKQ